MQSLAATVTTLSFELPGVLIDRETGILDWHRAWLREHGRRIDDGTVLATYEAVEQRLREQHPDTAFTSMLPHVHAELAAEWGLDSDETVALDFLDSVRDWPPFSDAIQGLRALHGRYRLAAVSRADSWAVDQMSRALGEPFDLVLPGDELDTAPPDPAYWGEVLARMQARPEQCLHCAAARSPVLDSAARAGLATAWLERREPRPETTAGATGATPDLHVHNLNELIASLRPPAA